MKNERRTDFYDGFFLIISQELDKIEKILIANGAEIQKNIHNENDDDSDDYTDI